jgi:hypothetical protein
VPRFTDHYELAAPCHRECLRARERDVRIVGTGNYNTSKSKPQHRNRCKTCGSGWKAQSLGVARCNEKRSTNPPRRLADSPVRDQRAPGAVRHKHRIRPRERERLIEPRDPIGAVRRFPIVLNYAKQRLVSGFPPTLPMSGIGVMKSRKNQRARHLAPPGAVDTSKVPSTASTKLRSSRTMMRLASAAAKFLRASGSIFSFFRYAS